MLHSENKGATLYLRALIDVLANSLVVNLASPWLLATWIVSNLKVPNLVPTTVNIRNQVALGNLLVVDVEQNFARRTIDRPAYGESLIGPLVRRLEERLIT